MTFVSSFFGVFESHCNLWFEEGQFSNTSFKTYDIPKLLPKEIQEDKK